MFHKLPHNLFQIVVEYVGREREISRLMHHASSFDAATSLMSIPIPGLNVHADAFRMRIIADIKRLMPVDVQDAWHHLLFLQEVKQAYIERTRITANTDIIGGA